MDTNTPNQDSTLKGAFEEAGVTPESVSTQSNLRAAYPCIQQAIEKANTVDRSHEGHHTALLVLIGECAKKDAPYLVMLSEYCKDRVANSKDSLCTKGTFAWLKEHFKVRISESGEVTRGREFEPGFTLERQNAAREKPWYDLTRDMAFKVPSELSLSAIASTAVKLEAAGKKSALPRNAEDLWAMYERAKEKARTSQKFQEWQELLKKKQEAEQKAA